jgi:hypothetical protein
MGEANRRRRLGRLLANADGCQIEGCAAEIYDETAVYLLDGSTDRTLFFGPVVWRASDGTSSRQWYFMVAGCDRRQQMRCDQLLADSEGAAVEFRAGIMLALVRHQPCVVIDFDDELQMARHAEAAWPCAKITRIREGIEEERSDRGAQA